MEGIGFYNLLSLIIGLSIIVVTCTIAFLFQKYYFSKYHGKVKNAIEVASSNNQNNKSKN